jgi:hypothetical protein
MPKSPQIHLHVSQLESGIQDYRLPRAFGLMLGTTWRTIIWPYYVIPVIRRPGFIITQFFLLLALFSVTRSLAIANLLWMSEFWNSRRTVCVETGSSGWILSSAVTFAAAVQWFLDIILFNVWRSLSFTFGFRPLFLLADSSHDVCMSS